MDGGTNRNAGHDEAGQSGKPAGGQPIGHTDRQAKEQ
jgi:hypothetical protein